MNLSNEYSKRLFQLIYLSCLILQFIIMKKVTFLSLILLLALVQTNAQNNPYMLTHLVSKDSTNTIQYEGYFSYDTDGKEVESIDYSYYGGTTYGSKTNWTYDNITGYITEKDYYNYNYGTSIWEPTYKTEFTQYDSNGNILEEINSYFNSGNNMWIYYLKTVYSYNNNMLDNKEDFYYG